MYREGWTFTAHDKCQARAEQWDRQIKFIDMEANKMRVVKYKCTKCWDTIGGCDSCVGKSVVDQGKSVSINVLVHQEKGESTPIPQQFYAPDKVCAWCYPGSAGNSFGSHGICPQHAEEMLKSVNVAPDSIAKILANATDIRIDY